MESDATAGSTPASPVRNDQGTGAPEFAAAMQPDYVNTLFVGADGLRPGWGLAFYSLMYLTLQGIGVQLVESRDFGASRLWSQMLGELADLVAAVVPALVLARVERRRWGLYGLPGRQVFGKRFWVGVVWGFAGISILMFGQHEAGVYQFGHVLLHGARVVRFAAFWAVMFLLVGLFEEFWLRGYTQFTLARGIGFWPAAAVLSCGFGLVHLRNTGETWVGALGAAAIGIFFCLTLRRTGSLWFAVGFHSAWDWGETFFFSVPDSGNLWPGHLLSSSLHGPVWLSGGSVGPEGSVLCFVVMAGIWVAFDRVYPGAQEHLTAEVAEKVR